MANTETMATPAPAKPVSKAKAITAITVGNALEFYDFIVYSALATVMGRLFFPSDDVLLSMLFSFAVFGTGFIARPIGGVVIGLYADRKGRRSALRLTLWLMAIGSVLFVVAPTYAQAGIWGSIVILLARLIQGFAVGGQVGASTSMLMEYATDKNRGFYCSWQIFSQQLGVLLGSVTVVAMTAVLTTEAMEAWGWRLVFGVGVLTIPVGEYIRHKLEETAAPAAEKNQKKENETEVEVHLYHKHLKEIVAGVLTIIGITAPTFIIGHYLANHAVTMFGMPLGVALLASFSVAVVHLLLSAHAGILSDRIGRRKIMLYSRIILLIMLYPVLMMIDHYRSVEALALGGALLAIPLTYGAVTTIAQLGEVFPRRIRASAMSIVYCMGVMIFGGFAQMIAVELIRLTGNPLSPAFYTMACLAISIIGVLMLKETAGKPLE